MPAPTIIGRADRSLVRLAVALALGILALAACSSTGSTGSTAKKTSKPLSHLEDAKIVTCAKDAAGFASAKVQVTNNSSKPSNYVITVAFESKDGATQIGTGLASVNSLQPKQKAVEDANSLKEAPAAGFTCKISDVTRLAA
jgi:hypothetical protein